MVISIVIPVFNEGDSIEHNLPKILSELENKRHIVFQILVVNDGSTDDTLEKLYTLCNKYDSLEIICFNRNFGKEAAIHAGLFHSKGDAAIVMDSDLQHPPNLISKMLALWEDGADSVEACKSSRGNESLPKKILAQGFYFTFKLLTKLDIKGHSDFKLLDRKVINAYLSLPERKRFFRGIIPWMGFPSKKIQFSVVERTHGKSSWARSQLIKFAITGLTGFTSTPLHIVTGLGVIYILASVVVGGMALYQKYMGTAVAGFPTVILLILITGALILFSLGQIGIYIEQIFDEIKQRPTYLINKMKSRLKDWQ